MTGQITIQEYMAQMAAGQAADQVLLKRESLGDEDIDEIVRQLDKIAWLYGIKALEPKLTTWAHVPGMGRRLTYKWIITRDHLANKRIWQAVGAVTDYADEHGVDLEPMTGGIFFFSQATEATMSFYSHFKDKRKRIKGKVEA